MYLSAMIRIFLKNYFILLFLFLLVRQGDAQDISYAHKVVDTLAAPGMHGRGYVEEGDKIASLYLRNEFRRLGLKPFNNRYFQEFNISVNTFPGTLKFSIGKEKITLVPGKDFLIEGNSPSLLYDATKLVWFDSAIVTSVKKTKKFLRKKFPDKILVIDAKGVLDKNQLELVQAARQNPFGAKALLIFNNKKLTWSVGHEPASYPSFELLVPDTLNALWRKRLTAVSMEIESKFIPNYTTQNVIGFLEGSQYPDSFIVFAAHYDHLGMMGRDACFPGANDNASGCAMLLNLAQHYSKPENKPKYSIAFIAFGAEEAGLLGSNYYVEHPLFPLKKIKFLLNMDIMGTGDEGITVVNATLHKQEFDTLVAINKRKNYLTQVKPRGKTQNSDHYFFSEKGVKTFFIYTMGGIKAYHDIYDRRETLPLTKFEDVFKLIKDFTGYLSK